VPFLLVEEFPVSIMHISSFSLLMLSMSFSVNAKVGETCNYDGTNGVCIELGGPSQKGCRDENGFLVFGLDCQAGTVVSCISFTLIARKRAA
jgi:hypothetical protein